MRGRVGFSRGKSFVTPKIEKIDQKMGQKHSLLEFIEKFGH